MIFINRLTAISPRGGCGVQASQFVVDTKQNSHYYSNRGDALICRASLISDVSFVTRLYHKCHRGRSRCSFGANLHPAQNAGQMVTVFLPACQKFARKREEREKHPCLRSRRLKAGTVLKCISRISFSQPCCTRLLPSAGPHLEKFQSVWIRERQLDSRAQLPGRNIYGIRERILRDKKDGTLDVLIFSKTSFATGEIICTRGGGQGSSLWQNRRESNELANVFVDRLLKSVASQRLMGGNLCPTSAAFVPLCVSKLFNESAKRRFGVLSFNFASQRRFNLFSG